jgi:hypothetical protein
MDTRGEAFRPEANHSLLSSAEVKDVLTYPSLWPVALLSIELTF